MAANLNWYWIGIGLFIMVLSDLHCKYIEKTNKSLVPYTAWTHVLKPSFYRSQLINNKQLNTFIRRDSTRPEWTVNIYDPDWRNTNNINNNNMKTSFLKFLSSDIVKARGYINADSLFFDIKFKFKIIAITV